MYDSPPPPLRTQHRSAYTKRAARQVEQHRLITNEGKETERRANTMIGLQNSIVLAITRDLAAKNLSVRQLN